MKKVAIITLNGYFNYGNRLQNYALQEVIKELGYDVETILHHETPKLLKEKKIKRNARRIYNLRTLTIPQIKKKIQNRFKEKNIITLRQERIVEFKNFTENYISETPFIISSHNLPDNLAEQYDFFVVGSDQIWNPNYQYHEDVTPAIEYITFAPKEKRLSYAASFGVSSIPQKYLQRVKQGLEGMSSILVRERAGVDLVKDLTGRDAELVLDPTMLLTKDKWLSIAEANNYKPKKKYILTYFLGELSSETLKYIQQVSNLHNLEIIHLEDISNLELYKANPSHFIDFINSATIFLTDSFHGVVFSILLETPFVVFKRKENGPSMYSRIETLLKTFELKSRQVDDIDFNSTYLLNMDFENIRQTLSVEREKSLTIFRDSFKK